MDRALPSRLLVRVILALVVLGLILPTAYAAVTYEGDRLDTLKPGTIDRAANGSTIVGIQGFHFQGEGSGKKPARLAAVDANGDVEWIHNGSERDATWFYEPDPLPNGNVLVVSTKPERTLVYEYDPDTDEQVWVEEFDIIDTHDITKISDDELAVANMRQWDEENETSNDRIFIYNLTTDEITWEWYFADIYPHDTDGGMNDDWSHVNDVEPVGDDQLLVSPRNFDQAVLINRTTKAVDLRLGRDDDHEILSEQHNPDYLESEDGTPTILVADSENHRVVEYELEECDGMATPKLPSCEWNRTWEIGDGQFTWPRDADRLPNGNTLITDTMNHRVVEVTPEGEVVWEYYAAWGPYDADRVAHGGSSKGPTIADQNATGTYELNGSAQLSPGDASGEPFGRWLARQATGTPVEGPVTTLATKFAQLTPWIRPVWLDSWSFVAALGGVVVGVGWALGEIALARRRIAAAVRRGTAGLRARI